LNVPLGIAVSGSDLFVLNSANGAGTGTIGEYTTAGATVNHMASGKDKDPMLGTLRRENDAILALS